MNSTIDVDGPKVFRFIGITFDENYKEGQDELNHAIEKGYKIAHDYRTESGIVFALVMQMDKQKIGEQRSLDAYIKDEGISMGAQKQ
jgi:hypothetical protein